MKKQYQNDDDPRLHSVVQSELKLKHLARAAREIQKPRKIGKIST